MFWIGNMTDHRRTFNFIQYQGKRRSNGWLISLSERYCRVPNYERSPTISKIFTIYTYTGILKGGCLREKNIIFLILWSYDNIIKDLGQGSSTFLCSGIHINFLQILWATFAVKTRVFYKNSISLPTMIFLITF